MLSRAIPFTEGAPVFSFTRPYGLTGIRLERPDFVSVGSVRVGIAGGPFEASLEESPSSAGQGAG
jgi:hypothetical protein